MKRACRIDYFLCKTTLLNIPNLREPYSSLFSSFNLFKILHCFYLFFAKILFIFHFPKIDLKSIFFQINL